ncbi:DNA topoisomerase [Aquibacillus koreensis]|uniref:DNA topoisomerase n=1 Tax=Aquibacillus koreensis TaxID=279446 RepID=A0A9X4AI89_9BACI|nr:type IA DNA topoisomerase [Aquibacillus koreensis]MCT2534224.1 DNA topoisomerase [Aquibacillus koreensis]MDC3420731.1 DNA topoisomerase [Aquibacillus koreensis]
MGTTVILAEKPSVAKNIADALKIKNKKDGYFEGDQYIITWAFGHLLQLFDAKDYDSKMLRWKMENFPFIPNQFKYKVKTNPRNNQRADAGVSKQLKTIGKLMKRNDVDTIISACDFDREGQLIGDSIISNINPGKKVYRLLLNEWTQQEVIEGLKKVRLNEEMRPLGDAGLSRQWADWVIGINLTSVATLKYQKGKGKALNIGRVLLPTLKIIYDRDKEIKQFVPEDYFKLQATLETKDNQEFQAVYVEGKQEKFKAQQPLGEIQKQLKDKSALVIDKHVERKKEFPPLLFNLSNLQGHITNKYKGWTSDKVLKVAQSLYEKKLITYPRTSSIALEESLVGKTAKVLQMITEDLPYKDEVTFVKSKRVFNNSKVESHSAIIPTYVKPKKLTSDQQIVYDAIKNRLIMQFMKPAEYEETKLLLKVKGISLKGIFVAKGKVQLIEGWKKVERMVTKDTLLPPIDVNEELLIINTELTAHTTKPPKYHTEKTLLRVMETCGKSYREEDSEALLGAILSGFSIGTPATRAETIKKLKDIGYITSESKNLLVTDLGRKLVETFPISELFDLEFTGRLEKTLSDIERKIVTKDQFLSFVFDFTNKAVATVKSDQDVLIQEITSQKKSTEVLGKCPICGNAIIEGTKGFGCSNWKNGCKFVVWKNDKYLAAMKKRVTKTMVKSLLKDKVVYVKGLTSKKGNKFNAYLSYEKNKDNAYFSWRMEFKK